VSELRSESQAPCKVRLGEPCRLCMPGASGPQDCGVVYLVMTDPDLRAELARMCVEAGAPWNAPGDDPETAVGAGFVR
jgi:hypothetical protein